MCAESMQGRIDQTGAGCLADTGSWLNGVGNHLYIDVWQLFCFSVINNVLNTVINNVLNIYFTKSVRLKSCLSGCQTSEGPQSPILFANKFGLDSNALHPLVSCDHHPQLFQTWSDCGRHSPG